MTEEEEIAELLESVRQTNLEALKQIKNHLIEYIQNNKKNSTFTGWISHLHPENVTIDHRITINNSDYLNTWNSKDISTLRNKYNLQKKYPEEPVELEQPGDDFSLSRTQAFRSRGKGKTKKQKKKKKKQKSKSYKGKKTK